MIDPSPRDPVLDRTAGASIATPSAKLDPPLKPAPSMFADWQFWLVTLIAVAAAAYLTRPLWRKKTTGKKQRITLTIGGQPVDRHR